MQRRSDLCEVTCVHLFINTSQPVCNSDTCVVELPLLLCWQGKDFTFFLRPPPRDITVLCEYVTGRYE